MKRLSAAIASIAMLLATSAAFAQETGPSPGGFHPMFRGGMAMHHGFAMIAPFVIVFALIGFFSVLGFVVRISTRGPRWQRGMSHRGPGNGAALDIIEQRFARGEIDKAEFEDKRALLNRR